MDYGPTSALIVVDVQNDFASPEGSLYVVGAEEAIPTINEHIAAAASAGARLVYTQDWHPPRTPHFVTDGGIWPVHCVGGSPGAEFHPLLTVVDDSLLVKKGVGGEDGYSAFNLRDPVTGVVTSTGLAEQLDDTESVVVIGLALDYCVKETAVDAAPLFSTYLIADATRAVNLRPGDAARAVASIVSAGVTIV